MIKITAESGKQNNVIKGKFDTARKFAFKAHIELCAYCVACRTTMASFMHVAQVDHVPHTVEG
jgi:arginyl-tRNA--protein-N-Asp/Glu arginylyltransferase